jgi:hypothetical protein
MKNKTECIYCGSTSYGTTCLFSPNKVHVHTGDPTTCMYCGSKSVGSGCLFNPYGKNHIRGPEYLNRFTEQAKDLFVLNYLTEKLKIKNDLNYSSPLDRFYKRISSLITNLSEPLLEAFYMLEKPSYKNLNKDQLVTAIESKNVLIGKLSEIKDILSEINLVLPTEIVEEIIVDAIISSND